MTRMTRKTISAAAAAAAATAAAAAAAAATAATAAGAAGGTGAAAWRQQHQHPIRIFLVYRTCNQDTIAITEQAKLRSFPVIF